MLLQPFLIDRIVKALCLENDSRVREVPATDILTSDKDRDHFTEDWHYRSTQEMLT